MTTFMNGVEYTYESQPGYNGVYKFHVTKKDRIKGKIYNRSITVNSSELPISSQSLIAKCRF